MAKKRLNKKVAVIGLSLGLVLFASAAYVAWDRYGPRDPQKMLQNAMEAVEREDYMVAGKYFNKAFSNADDDAMKIKILFKVSEVHVINSTAVDKGTPAYHEARWDKAVVVWEKIINIDSQNVQARRKLLDFFYENADAGNVRAWSRVETTAGELIDVLRAKQVQVDPPILLARGRAMLEMAVMGQQTDRQQALDGAMDILREVVGLAPDNVEVYGYLARGEMLRGQIESGQGIQNAEAKALQRAEQIMNDAISAAPDNPQGYVNLLNMKLQRDAKDKDKLESITDQFRDLSERFPDSSETWQGLAKCYQFMNDTVLALEAMSMAAEIDPQNAVYATTVAQLYYRTASVEDKPEYAEKAIAIAVSALEFPSAQILPGPRESANINNRYNLLSLLGYWYVEQAIGCTDEQIRVMWVQSARDVVDQIKQIILAAEDVRIIKWDGILALAGGRRAEAIGLMYNAYEQLKGREQSDPVLSYMLAEAFADRPELGARKEFLESALFSPQGGIAFEKPEAILEYARLLLGLGVWNNAVAVAEMYERLNRPDTASTEVRVGGYIGAGQFDQAEQLVKDSKLDKTKTLELQLDIINARVIRVLQEQTRIRFAVAGLQGDESQAMEENKEQLDVYQEQRTELLEQLLAVAPVAVKEQILVGVYDYCVRNKQSERGEKIVSRFMEHSPKNVRMGINRRMLAEPDEVEVTTERQDEIVAEVLKDIITDPIDRKIFLVAYYREHGRDVEAKSLLLEVYNAEPDRPTVVETLFDIALTQKDMELAGQLQQKAEQLDMDGCQGKYYAARLAVANEDYPGALNLIDEALQKMPVFAQGNLLRGIIYNAMGKRVEALQDIERAVVLMPTSRFAMRTYALSLVERQLSSSTATEEQYAETERALARAISLNQNDQSLMSVYAEFTSSKAPARALAIRQALQNQSPTVSNHLLLGNMAARQAKQESDAVKRAALIDLADSAYKKACDAAPENETVVRNYSEFLSATDRQEQALKILSARGDLLWQFYLHDGQFDKALTQLEELLADNPDDPALNMGMAQVAYNIADKARGKKYADKLVEVENTIDNQLFQIQIYLQMGIDPDMVGKKLASFRERNPDEPRGVMLETWYEMTMGRLTEAMKLANRSLELDRNSAVAWRLRGQINRLRNDPTSAVEDLQKSSALSPDPAIRMELAMAYRMAGKIDAAIGELKKTLESSVAPVRVRKMLEEIYIGAGRTGELKRFYEQTIAKYPESSHWNFRAGLFALGQKDFGRATELFDNSWQQCDKQSQNWAILDLYLESLFQRGEYALLLEKASQYTDGEGELAAIAYAQIAQTRMKMGSRSMAVDLYHKALEKCDVNQTFIEGILINMSQTVGADQVEQWCIGMLERQPNSVSANLMMFKIVVGKNQYNNAIDYIDKCMELVGKQDSAWTTYSIDKSNVLISAYVKTSQKQYISEAIAALEEILEIQPNNVSVMNNLAYLLADNDMVGPKALEYARKSYEAGREDANRIDTYAYVLAKAGQYEEAEQMAQMAVQHHEMSDKGVPWDVYEHLGMAREGLGQKEGAIQSYETALERAGTNIAEKDKDRLNRALSRLKN